MNKSKEEFDKSIFELRQWIIKEAWRDIDYYGRVDWTDDHRARDAEMQRVIQKVADTANTYVYDQFEAGHDIGYETAQSDYIAGFWDE